MIGIIFIDNLKISTTDKLSVPARTTTIASQSQTPLPPLATAAVVAAREEVRLWDRGWTIPGSVDAGLEEGLGLEVGNKRTECWHRMDRKLSTRDGNWKYWKNGPRCSKRLNKLPRMTHREGNKLWFNTF